MAKHSKRHKVHTEFISGIAIRQTGAELFMVDFMRDGQRTRKSFGTLAEAKAYAQLKAVEIRNKGTEALSLPDRQRVELGEALSKLNGRATITEVVAEWIKRHPDNSAERWDTSAEAYISKMIRDGKRPGSIQEKELKFNILSKALNNPATCAVEHSDITKAVEDLAIERGWTELTKAAYTGAGMTLLRFYRGEGKGCAKKDECPPETWTADFIATMMHTAEKVTPGIVPALAVLTFAGLRPHEMLRLDWQAVNLDKGWINLTGEYTKTRTSRYVEITPNLREWLTAYHGTGKIVDTQARYRYLRQQLMKALNITVWPNDVLRHTAATMIYARTNSVDVACKELGHFGTQMFLKHYKGLAPLPDDVAKFWGISPKKEQGK